MSKSFNKMLHVLFSIFYGQWQMYWLEEDCKENYGLLILWIYWICIFSLAMFSKPKLNFHYYHWTKFVKFWKNWTSLLKSPCRRLFQYLNHFHLFQLIVQKSKVYMVYIMHSSVYRASISVNHDLAVPGIK